MRSNLRAMALASIVSPASCHAGLYYSPSHLKNFASMASSVMMLERVKDVPLSLSMKKYSIRGKDKQSVNDVLDGNERKSTRQRSRKHELKRRALAVYQTRFAKALQAELTEEMQEMKERLRHWSKQQLEAEGLALFDLSARLDGNLYRDKVLRFYKNYGDGILPPHNQFSQGDIVVISKKNPLDEQQNVVEGVVMERARRFIKVSVSPSQLKALSLHTKWRLDLSANRVAYERCLFAIGIFSSPLAHQQQAMVCNVPTIGDPNSTNTGWLHDGPISFGEGATSIRALIMKFEEENLKVQLLNEHVEDDTTAHEAKDITQYPALQNCESSEEVKIAENPPSQIGGKNIGTIKGGIRAYLRELEGKLNASQKAAIEAAACQKVTLWQGPPGTGKTKTLAHFIFALCRNRGKVIACADSNVAVDNLVEGLLELGLRVARVGQPVKVKEELRESTVEAQVIAHPLMKRSADLKKAAAVQRLKSRQINNSKRRVTSAKEANSAWDKAMELEAKAINDVLDRADVVAATCIGAGDDILKNRSFCVCVIDEASQATEPASLVPILRSRADCIVLVGDPAQLPPTVLSSGAIEAGLAVSLFQHLQECGLRPCFLDTQYRMHPAIAALPSVLFYSGRLKSHPLPSERPAPNGFAWPNKKKPVAFIDCVDGKEETTAQSNSCFNRAEAEQVVKVVQLLIASNDIDGGCQGVGVIAPYSAQVRLLQDMFLFGQTDGHEKFAGLEVKTVDGFQGREKEAIVFCTVRSNRNGQLGFLTDPRRMNVALTRAKCGVVVIGNSKTLEFDKNWATWLNEMRREQLYLVSESLGQC